MNRTIHRTRYAGIGFVNVAPGLWRFADIHEGIKADEPPRTVGPEYPSKMELLADLDRYARDSWGYGENRDHLLKDYLVMVQEGEAENDPGYWNFHCQAEDPEHAREQAIGHGDAISVLSVYQKVA